MQPLVFFRVNGMRLRRISILRAAMPPYGCFSSILHRQCRWKKSKKGLAMIRACRVARLEPHLIGLEIKDREM
jgi:hypothetical protein